MKKLEWDSPEWRAVRNEKLNKWFKGSEDAVSLCCAFSQAAEVWDDLVDQDKKVAPEEASLTFQNLLINLPTNPLYLKYQPWFTALSIITVNAFHDSNSMQYGDKNDRIAAFHLRRMGVEFACLVACCVGGYQHMREVSLEIRQFFYEETFEEWEKDHVKLS